MIGREKYQSRDYELAKEQPPFNSLPSSFTLGWEIDPVQWAYCVGDICYEQDREQQVKGTVKELDNVGLKKILVECEEVNRKRSVFDMDVTMFKTMFERA